MCLAIPGKIVEIDKNEEHGIVDYGDGTKRKVNISLVEVKVGDYVLVHAGFAIEVLDENFGGTVAGNGAGTFVCMDLDGDGLYAYIGEA